MPFEIAKLKAPSVQIKELIEDMYAMTRHTRNELKAMVYWSIATHGHEWLRVFPLCEYSGELTRARLSPFTWLKICVEQGRARQGTT